jgi:hypothetical protein
MHCTHDKKKRNETKYRTLHSTVKRLSVCPRIVIGVRFEVFGRLGTVEYFGHDIQRSDKNFVEAELGLGRLQ